MWILPLVGYLGVIVGFTFLTLAIGKQPDNRTHGDGALVLHDEPKLALRNL
jgi:hypothetical protein